MVVGDADQEGRPAEAPAQPPAEEGGRGAAETTQRFAPRPPAQPPGTTQSFAPRPTATPQPLQWNAPADATPPPQGATSPVPAPLATQSFMPAQAVAPPVEPVPPPVAPTPPPADEPTTGTPAAAPAVARRPRADAPPLPLRPSTLTAAVAIATVETVTLVAGGALLVALANGGGDWLQTRLDDYNRNHSATSIDAFQHAVDVVGAGAIAAGVIVLLLAVSSWLYGSVSRLVLTGVEVALIAVAGLGVVVNVLSLAYAALPIAVLVLLLAPPTGHAFAAARDAQEEWQAS